MPREGDNGLRLEGRFWTCWGGNYTRKRRARFLLSSEWRAVLDELAEQWNVELVEVARRLLYAGLLVRFRGREEVGPWGGVLRPNEARRLIEAGWKAWQHDDHHHRRRLAELTEPGWVAWVARTVGELDPAEALGPQLLRRRRAEKVGLYFGPGFDAWLEVERDGWFRWCGAKAAAAFRFFGLGLSDARVVEWLKASTPAELARLEREWTPTPPPARPVVPPIPASRARAPDA